MRAVLPVLILLVAAVAAWLAYRAIIDAARNRRRELRQNAQWQFHHYSDGAETVVAASRVTADGDVLEQQVIDRFAASDERWTERFLAARLAAEERALYLNAGGSLPAP
jgi:hypothetical protein